jgi:glycerol-3-phosphate dehydrogenase (NAD(P)+)
MSVGVIGAGAWGTALAQVAAAGGDVLIWAREPEVVAAINSIHENTAFLPPVPSKNWPRATCCSRSRPPSICARR